MGQWRSYTGTANATWIPKTGRCVTFTENELYVPWMQDPSIASTADPWLSATGRAVEESWSAYLSSISNTASWPKDTDRCSATIGDWNQQEFDERCNLIDWTVQPKSPSYFTAGDLPSASPLVIVPETTMMSYSSSQTLSVSGGVAPFVWYLSAGGGSIWSDSSTISAFYTAPSTNDPPLIAVLDRYQTYDDQAISLLPSGYYMLAWYKFDDDMSETPKVIHNYAPTSVIINGVNTPTKHHMIDVPIAVGTPGWYVPNQRLLWSGTEFASGADTYGMTGISTFGIFQRVTSWVSGFQARGVMQWTPQSPVYWNDYLEYFNGMYAGPNLINYSYRIKGATWAYSYLTGEQTQNKWTFVFITNRFSPYPPAERQGYIQIHIVLDTGVKYATAEAAYTHNNYLYFSDFNLAQGYEAGVGWRRFIGVLGDMVWYHPDLEMTVSAWAGIYDVFRGYYGMAARSGW